VRGAIRTTVQSYGNRYDVYSECRVILYDAILDGEPLFDKYEHGTVIGFESIDKNLWKLLDQNEREVAYNTEIGHLRNRLKQRERTVGDLKIGLVALGLTLFALFWNGVFGRQW
jgi:hypothetical protein